MPYQPLPLQLPPGLARQASSRASRGRWYDGNLVRWRDGVLQPMGGWKALPFTLPSPARAMLSWKSKAGVALLAIGTREKLFIWDGTLRDITPADMVVMEPPGLLDGFGVGDFGEETFGTPRTIEETGLARVEPGDVWALDNWGEDLLALHTGNGKLYRWKAAGLPTDLAEVVPNAPIGATAMCVTEERAVALAGQSNDARRLAWSDIENLEDWTATPDNIAGGLTLKTAGKPMAMRRSRDGVLVLTDDDAHLLRYVGVPLGYGIDRLATGCGPASPLAVTSTAEFVVWLGAKGIWAYRGSVEPVPCPVGHDLAALLNRKTIPLAYAGVLDNEQEIFIGWPSEAANECDRYLLFSWRDSIWTWGRLQRCAFAQAGGGTNPLLAGLDGKVYEHEVGFDADGATRVGDVWAETSDIELSAGAKQLVVRGIIPDTQGERDAVRFRFFLRDKPHGPEREVGPLLLQPGRDWIEARFAATSIRVRVEATRDRPWALGEVRLDAVPGSAR